MQESQIISDAKETIEYFYQQYPKGVVIIRWATATGKTKLSVALSQYFDIEIISADSRQIFRHMDIGTDKISKEIRQKLPHHLIDIIDPNESFTAWQRKQSTEQAINNIQKKWKKAMIVWGTGLYIDTIYKNYSLSPSAPNYSYRKQLEKKEREHPWILHQELQRIDPQSANKIHPHSTRYIIRALEIYHETWKTKTESCKEQAVQYPLLMLWLRRSKEETNNLINKRIKEMINSGLKEEVESLLKLGYHKNLQSMQWIGYKETVEYLTWNLTHSEREYAIQHATYHLAKKQRTRFRRYIRDAQEQSKTNVRYKVYRL